MSPSYALITSHKIYYVKLPQSVTGLRSLTSHAYGRPISSIVLVNSSVEKKKRGRPVKDDSFIYVTIGLRPAQWRWLALWFPNGSPSDQIRSLLDRAMKFWPGGPFVFRGGVR